MKTSIKRAKKVSKVALQTVSLVGVLAIGLLIFPIIELFTKSNSDSNHPLGTDYDEDDDKASK